MQYKNIEIFLELVRTRNITKAAEQMYLSQSTISNRLKSLENELGYELIQRSKGQRMVRLTPQGEAFVPVAQRWKNLYEETRLLKERAVQTLRIATAESVYYEFLSAFLIDLMNKHPAIKPSVQICDTAHIYDLVDKNLIDYGFAAYESYRNEIIIESIMEQSLCVIRHRDPPAARTTIHPRDLDPTKEISFTGGYFANFRAWHEKWFGATDVCAVEINSPLAAIPFLKEFGYWALCPIDSALVLSREYDLQVCHLEDPPERRTLYLLKRQGSSKDTAVCRLFEQELKRSLSAAALESR